MIPHMKGSSNKFTKKLVKLLCQNCWIEKIPDFGNSG
jgi:hypothetical protein